MAAKKTPGPRARARQANKPKAPATATTTPDTTDEDSGASRAKLNDFLADYGYDASGRAINDPQHYFHQLAEENPEEYANIKEHYGLDELSYEVKDILGLSSMDVSPTGRSRGGLPAGERMPDYGDTGLAIEDVDVIGSDTGYLSKQLEGASGSAKGRTTYGDLSTPLGTSSGPPQRGGALRSPSRRRAVLPRRADVRSALSRTQSDIASPDPEAGVRASGVTPSQVAETRKLSDVPKDPRWTDLGLLPVTSARTVSERGWSTRAENKLRGDIAEATTRLELERGRTGSISVPRSTRVDPINPALAEALGPSDTWHPATMDFFKKSGFGGIFGGSTAGGTTVIGSDRIPRKVGTRRVGPVTGSGGQLLRTATSERYPKGALINVDFDKLSNQFQRSDVDLATGETIRRPELDVQVVPGTGKSDIRAAEFELVSPLDESTMDPMDPNYTPRYAVTGLPITDPTQQAAARAHQASRLAGGAQPFQTGVSARGTGTQTEPTYSQREEGSGTGMRPAPSPTIQKMARESGQSAEDALDVIRELGGRYQEMESMLEGPDAGSPYGNTGDVLRKSSKAPQRFVTGRRIQVPRASGALKRNKETGALEKATTGYEVFAPTESQMSDYLDAMAIEPGSRREADIVKRMDTGTGSFVKRKMTAKQKATPFQGDTSVGGKRSSTFLKKQAARPSEGQFSAVFEARLRAGEQKREAESQTRENAFKELRSGANKEYDTAGYIQDWDKLESVSGRGIMAPARMDAQDFSSRLLGTDVEQFTADQTGTPVRSTSEYGVLKRPEKSYNRPAFYRSNVNKDLPTTSPGGTPLYDEKMATPFAAFATGAPEPVRTPPPAVADNPQFAAALAATPVQKTGATAGRWKTKKSK